MIGLNTVKKIISKKNKIHNKPHKAYNKLTRFSIHFYKINNTLDLTSETEASAQEQASVPAAGPP